jgi:hypothetical protein
MIILCHVDHLNWLTNDPVIAAYNHGVFLCAERIAQL